MKNIEDLKKQLKNELANGRYETLSEGVYKIIYDVIRFVSYRKITVGYFTLLLATYLFTIAPPISYLWLHTGDLENILSKKQVIVLVCWGGLVSVLQISSARYYAQLLRTTLISHVIDGFHKETDVLDLRRWLDDVFSKKKQLKFCFLIALVLSIVTPFFLDSLYRDALGFSLFFFSFVSWFQGITGWYFLIPGLTLPSRLESYDITLFSLDPSSSAILSSLLAMIQKALFVAIVISTIFSAGAFYFGFKSMSSQIAFLGLGTWGPIIVIFLYYQISLSSLAAKAKRETLIPIQVKMDELYQVYITSTTPESMIRLKEMTEFYNSIKSCSITVTDWRGYLSFFNTLLLPIFSLAVSLLDKH